jgi:hypothetical protein
VNPCLKAVVTTILYRNSLTLCHVISHEAYNLPENTKFPKGVSGVELEFDVGVKSPDFSMANDAGGYKLCCAASTLEERHKPQRACLIGWVSPGLLGFGDMPEV